MKNLSDRKDLKVSSIAHPFKTVEMMLKTASIWMRIFIFTETKINMSMKGKYLTFFEGFKSKVNMPDQESLNKKMTTKK